jgi:hypothetical protein
MILYRYHMKIYFMMYFPVDFGLYKKKILVGQGDA